MPPVDDPVHRAVFSAVHKVKPLALGRDHDWQIPLGDLGVDSVDLARIIAMCEQELNLPPGMRPMEMAPTAADLERDLEQRCAETKLLREPEPMA